jgi:hypothetical protein
MIAIDEHSYLKPWAKAIYLRDRALIEKMSRDDLTAHLVRVLTQLYAQPEEIERVRLHVQQLIRDDAPPPSSPVRTTNRMYR